MKARAKAKPKKKEVPEVLVDSVRDDFYQRRGTPEEAREEESFAIEHDHAMRAQRRTAELRKSGPMNVRDPFFIPQEIIPDGWTYFWIRRIYAGIEDHARQSEAVRLGATLVPSSRHKELFFDSTKDYIERGGQILYEIPTERANDFKREIDNRSMNELRSLQGVSYGDLKNAVPTMVYPNSTPARDPRIGMEFSM